LFKFFAEIPGTILGFAETGLFFWTKPSSEELASP